jgi:excisionase family DNA binding protein
VKKYHGYLKPWEVSKYLGMPLETVKQMIESEELPSIVLDGDVRVPWDKLEAWLDEEVDEGELGKLGKHLDKSEKDVKNFVDGEK